MIDRDTLFGSIEKESRLEEESAELGEAKLTGVVCTNGLPPTNDGGVKLVSKESSGKASDSEDVLLKVFVGVCVGFSLSKVDLSASRSDVEVWEWV